MKLTKKSQKGAIRIVALDSIMKPPNDIMATRRLSTAENQAHPIGQIGKDIR